MNKKIKIIDLVNIHKLSRRRLKRELKREVKESD